MKYLGCAYYPEYWGLNRIDADAALMREAGMNVVRIGEFAWSHMEPQDGRFTFDWLKQAVNRLAKYDIQTILCTPAAAAPAWLVHAHPETLIVNKHGQRVYHGVRQHTCYVSPVFLKYAGRVVEAMAKEMAGNKSVIGWQIDNEIGCSMFGNCHCEACQARFREWLRKRYGNLETLNRAWGTSFWSMVYTDWDEICLGDHGLNLAASRVLDSYRFFSEIKIEYALQQAQILRRYFPETVITTNNFAGVDLYRGFETLDRAGADLYFSGDYRGLICNMDLYRGIKPDTPYWLLETGIGREGLSVVPHNRRFRPCFWSFIAHGAEAVTVFRWRACLSGQEQCGYGILEHSGAARHRYKAVQQAFLESRGLKERLVDLPLPKSEVGIICDYDVDLACAAGRLNGLINPFLSWLNWYEAFSEQHVPVDFLPPGRSWQDYRLILLPPTPYVPKSLAEKIRSFTAGGGVIVSAGPLGIMNQYANYLLQSGPEYLKDVFGITLEGELLLRRPSLPWDTTTSKGIASPVTGTIGRRKVKGTMSCWMADVELNGAKALLAFTKGSFAGQPAVTMHRFGKGSAIYAAAPVMNKKLYEKLLAEALVLAGVKPLVKAPAEVDIVRRGSTWFLINHADKALEVRLNKKGRALLGRYAVGRARLKPYDVCIIEAQDDKC